MRKRPALAEQEDISGLAGWMYSDLLLGLMVVFLATVSFVPLTTGQWVRSLGADKVAYTYMKVHDVPFTRSYTEFNIDRLRADIEAFRTEQGLAKAAFIGRARFVGSYGPGETVEDGIGRAVAFSEALDRADPKLLKLASSSVRTVPESTAPRIVVEFTFATETRVLEDAPAIP